MLKPRGKSLRSRPSFAGTGLLERMRSTIFALLGTMAAMALGLVALISSQGLPVLPGLPVPGLSSEQSQVDDARAIAAPHPAPSPSPASGAAQRAVRGGGTQVDRSDSSGLAGSRQLATAQDPVPADPGVPGPPSEEAPAAPTPTAPPSSDAPPATAPAESSPEPPAAVGTSPGKATAVVDPSDAEEGSEQSAAEEAASKRSSRGSRGNGKPAPAPAPPPSQAPDAAAAEDEAADVAEPTPSQAEIAEDDARRGGRGHGSRRSRR